MKEFITICDYYELLFNTNYDFCFAKRAFAGYVTNLARAGVVYVLARAIVALLALALITVAFKIAISMVTFNYALGDRNNICYGNVDIPLRWGGMLKLNVIAVRRAAVVAEGNPFCSSACGAYD